MDENTRCRLLLDLREGFTEPQLRQAYHDMVKVWHPDRFAHDERLRQIAQEKLKVINGAYEFLLARLFEESIIPPSSTPSETPEDHAPGSRKYILPILCGILAIALVMAGAAFYFHKKQTVLNGPGNPSTTAAKPEASPQPVADSSNWEVLFDGSSVAHWRGFRSDSFPDQSWDSRNNILQTIEGAQPVDLITRDEYPDFELELEWRISRGGNSGILFHVSEDVEKPWQSGPEMQLLDDDQHPDGKNPKTSAGSLFDLIAPQNKHLNPVGDWNQTRVLVSGGHVEYWLNGTKVVEYELGSDSLKALIDNSQFRNQQSYARQKNGHIVLQSYESQVGFRNIKIRRLERPAPPDEP